MASPPTQPAATTKTYAAEVDTYPPINNYSIYLNSGILHSK